MYKYFTAKIHDSLRTGSDGKPIYLSSEANVTIDGVEALPYLKIPTTIERSINPSDASAYASNLTFEIHNVDEDFSIRLYERMNSEGTLFWNEKVEFWGHTGTEKVLLYSGLVDSITSDAFETVYKLKTTDIISMLKTEIFARELGQYTDPVENIFETVGDVNNHRLPYGFTCYERTDAEGETIRYITFKGHPIDFLIGVCQALFSNPTNSVTASYLDYNYTNYLDMDNLNQTKEDLSSSIFGEFTFTFYESIENPLDFCKEQIFRPCVVLPYINNKGKLGLKLNAQPQTDEHFEIFNSDKIKDITNKSNSISSLVNHLRIYYNHLISDNEDRFNKSLYSIEPDSLKKMRFLSPKGSPLSFEVEGINFGFNQPSKQMSVIRNMVDSYFSRYSQSVTNITFSTTIDNTYNINVGDYIGLEHDKLIDWNEENLGRRGLTKEIIDAVDPISKLNVGDGWVGFVQNNRLGTDSDGVKFLETTFEEMKFELFVGDTYSCKVNHDNVDSWLNFYG